MSNKVDYYLDRVAFKSFGVFVSDSSGLLNKPSFKEGFRNDWGNENGFDIDLNNRYRESKTITIDCFIRANSLMSCVTAYNTFLNEIDKKGSRRLSVEAGSLRLEYLVFRTDAVETKLHYDETNSVGVFKLKLVENMPIKRILKSSTAQLDITIRSSKILLIDWGDGTQTYTNGSGQNQVINKSFLGGAAVRYPMIVGDIEAITFFQTNAETLWSKF